MTNRKSWIALAGLLLLLHGALVLRHYPVSVLAKGDIPVKGDVSRYFATVNGMAGVGGLYGYDPYFMAGYPVGLWNSMGKKGFEVSRHAFPWVPLPALFYCVIVGVCFTAPLMLWLAVRRFCPSVRLAVILLVLCLLYWHLGSQIAYFWGFGNVFFPATCCLLIPLVCWTWSLPDCRYPFVKAAGLGILAALIFYCHTVVLVAALVPIMAVLVARRDKFRQGHILAAGLVSLAVFCLLAGLWAIPLLRSRDMCLASPKAWFVAGAKHFAMDWFSDRGYLRPFDRRLLLHLAALAGIAGTVYSWRSNKLFSVLGLGGIACLCFAYTGSSIGLAELQPYRFLIPAVILLLCPAAVGLQLFAERFAMCGKAARTCIALLGLVVVPQFTAYLIDFSESPLPCGVQPRQREAIEQLSTTPIEGRLLCDDIGLGHILPYYEKIPVIGGLSSQAFLKHRHAGMDYEGELFGRSADAWKNRPDSELKACLDLYAIDFALFVRPEWVAFARERSALFEPYKKFEGYELFTVRDASPSLVFKGQGVVKADYSGIHVSEAGPGELILKLHHVQWLKAGGGVSSDGIKLLDDPVPFIRLMVPEGVAEFTVAGPS